MATTPTPQAHPAIQAREHREIRIYAHSPLFYWWPVWAVGFLMALITWIDGHRLAVIPADTNAKKNADGTWELVPPKNAVLTTTDKNRIQPDREISSSAAPGAIFATVLLVIIVISNVPLRGLWSLLIILFIVLVVVLLALFDQWPRIVATLSLLDIRINFGGYFFIAAVLFAIWAVTVFIFDHRTYVVVTPGQVRVCMAVGAGETAYDTTGMTFRKRQDDLFRHWIVGLGSGDLIIHRTNTTEEIDMPNVLFIGAKVNQITELIKERKIVVRE
jgi:hypothetical protein